MGQTGPFGCARSVLDIKCPKSSTVQAVGAPAGMGRKPVSDLAVSGGIIIYAERVTEICGDTILLVLERNTGRIGNADDGVEDGEHTGSIDQRRPTNFLMQPVPRGRKDRATVLKEGIGIAGERRSRRDAAVCSVLSDHRRKVVVVACVSAAPTEQHSMAGGSIDAAVDRRHPPC